MDQKTEAALRAIAQREQLLPEECVARLIEEKAEANTQTAQLSTEKRHQSLHEFFMNSPLRRANLDLERVNDYPRAIDLE